MDFILLPKLENLILVSGESLSISFPPTLTHTVAHSKCTKKLCMKYLGCTWIQTGLRSNEPIVEQHFPRVCIHHIKHVIHQWQQKALSFKDCSLVVALHSHCITAARRKPPLAASKPS